jgi:hypothetical protein
MDIVATDQLLAFYKAYLDKGPEQAAWRCSAETRSPPLQGGD